MLLEKLDKKNPHFFKWLSENIKGFNKFMLEFFNLDPKNLDPDLIAYYVSVLKKLLIFESNFLIEDENFDITIKFIMQTLIKIN
jgi:hypothetical protein